ncbi:MAG: hypothetical protein CL843_05510 [Crocinitomicaceae bacterium]|nr:hypothetical protein [Crocinitomicaceae bacterium]|tara:strand:- start:2005 stop:2571 length:567 start_codon:yes stop_codon:yes gene_type:complete
MNPEEKADLEQLVEDCKKGKRKAQHQIYKLLYSKMLLVCLRYFKDVDSAKDILQEGFIKLFLNIHKYDGGGSFAGWARRLIVNTAIDELRRNKNIHFTSVDETEYEWLEDDGDDELIWNEVLMREKDRVLDAIQDLSPAYRTVFNMYVIEDYSHKEIADSLGISEGTSKSNLAKAKMKLKKVLGELQY